MSEEVKEGMFRRGWNATKKAPGKVADLAWRGGTKRKYATGALALTTVGIGGYYAHRKMRRNKMESGME